MADPLSLAASVIAVIGAASTISKTLSKVKLLRKAPTSLLALNNEITDLTIILRTVEKHLSSVLSSVDLEQSTPSQDVLQQITSLVDRAKDHLLQLDQLIHYQLLESGTLDGDYKVFRIRWIRARNTIENHQNSLQDIKQGVLLQLAVLNSFVTSFWQYLILEYSLTGSSIQQTRVRLIVDEVFLITKQLRISQLNDSDRTTHQLIRQSNLLNDLLSCHGQLHDRLQSAQILTEQEDEKSLSASRKMAIANNIPFVVGIRTHLSMYQQKPCATLCRCNCHNVQSFRSPPLLRNLLGFVFIKYSGYPFGLSRQCSDVVCQSQPHFKARAIYYFPFWLFSRMIDMTFMLSYSHEPSLSLAVRGTFSANSDIWRVIMLDDAQGVQSILNKRAARPNDVEIPGGRSSLHRALNIHSFKVCKALIDAGADPYQEDDNGRSAFMMAWDYIYTKALDQKDLECLHKLFPDREQTYLQEGGFSKLHKAVLGADVFSLKNILTFDSANIDKPDSNGSTPLIWSARKKDFNAMEVLLKAGADPNVHTKTGCTALHFAVFNSDIKSIKILLQHGATATHKDNGLDNALHYAGVRSKSLEVFRILLATGIDIETRDIWSSTALACSAAYNNTVAITALLDFGAQIDVRDAEGDTPLLEAAVKCRSESVQILLERGANYTLMNRYGNTILHQAAQGGDLQTINVIRNANLKTVDPYARNKEGKAPFELAQARVSKPDGFIDLFLVLLFEIRNRNDYLAGCQRPNNNHARTSGSVIGEINDDGSSSDGSDTEEFFDAQE